MKVSKKDRNTERMNIYKTQISHSLELISLLMLSSSAVSPVLSEIGAAYPNVPETIVALLTTLPTLIAIPVTLITGRIIGIKIRYRTVIIWGIILNLVGGLMPIVTKTFELLLVWRAILGLGTGFLTPVVVPIMMAVFQGKEIHIQASKNSVSTNIGAVAFQMFGGVLCASLGWRGTFLVYSIFIPSLIIICTSMPEPQIKNVISKDTFTLLREGTKPVLKWYILYMVHMLFFYVAITEMSKVVADSHFGNSSVTGIALSIITVGGILGGIVYQWLYHFGAKTFSIAYTFLAVGYLIMQFSASRMSLILGAFIVGIGFGIHMPAIQVAVGKDAEKNKRGEAAAVASVFASIGSFFSKFLMTAIVGLLGKQTGRASFGVCVVGYFMLAVIVLFLTSENEKIKFGCEIRKR